MKSEEVSLAKPTPEQQVAISVLIEYYAKRQKRDQKKVKHDTKQR